MKFDFYILEFCVQHHQKSTFHIRNSAGQYILHLEIQEISLTGDLDIPKNYLHIFQCHFSPGGMEGNQFVSGDVHKLSLKIPPVDEANNSADLPLRIEGL